MDSTARHSPNRTTLPPDPLETPMAESLPHAQVPLWMTTGIHISSCDTPFHRLREGTGLELGRQHQNVNLGPLTSRIPRAFHYHTRSPCHLQNSEASEARCQQARAPPGQPCTGHSQCRDTVTLLLASRSSRASWRDPPLYCLWRDGEAT